MSLFRISLIWLGCLLLLQTTLPTSVWAKQNFSYPNTGATGFGYQGDGGFSVSSPSFPDTQLPGFVDHSSMSPDSWSAPPTGPVMAASPIAPPTAIQFAPNQSNPAAAQFPSGQFFQTPLSGFGQANDLPNQSVGDIGRSVISNSNDNFFQPKAPKLLEFDSRNALSNSAESSASDDTPNVPDLRSSSPFKLATTGANAFTENASKTGAQSAPAPRFASLDNGAVTGQIPIDQIAPLQNVQRIQGQNFESGFGSQPQLTNQPAMPQQFIPHGGISPQSSSGWGYPEAQNSVGNSMQSAFPAPQAGFPSNSIPGLQAPSVQASAMQNLSMQLGMQPDSHFRSDLGFRSSAPTVRHAGAYDNGEKFDFEDKKKQYPPFSEILATGRYFGSLAGHYVRPHAQNNTAFTTTSANFVEGITFDYDFELAPFVRFGFESKYGPGIEFDYFKFNGKSNQAQFTSNGAVTAQVQTLGSGGFQFGTSNAGETLRAQHTINFETFGVSFFKEVDLPISRINGRFGFQYVSIAHNLDANLNNVGGQIGVFNSRSDFRGFGPKFTLEYYRPVGHTPLEFVTTISGGAVYGRRDQFVDNTLGQGFSRAGADEFLTTIEFNSGLQFRQNIAENRSFFGRVGVTHTTWLGGGTAVDPQSDFGLRGISFTVGYNR